MNMWDVLQLEGRGKDFAHKIFNFGKPVNNFEGISPDRDKPLNPLQGDEPAH